MFFLHFSCGLLRMMPFIGACISALAIDCSKARATSFCDIRAHHLVSSMSRQCGSGPGLFHRVTAPFIPMQFRPVIILSSMSFRSFSDKAVQSRMACGVSHAFITVARDGEFKLSLYALKAWAEIEFRGARVYITNRLKAEDEDRSEERRVGKE